MKTKKFIALILFVVLLVTCFSSCLPASTVVNSNLSNSADNFEVLRRITVYNARTDLVVLQMEGYMSISNNSYSELVVTCKTGADEYKKNYISLNEYVIYVVEDISGTSTDPFHYCVHFYTPIPDIELN